MSDVTEVLEQEAPLLTEEAVARLDEINAPPPASQENATNPEKSSLVSRDTNEKPESAETPQETESWIDDDVRAEASQYGIDEEKLKARFSDRAAWEAAATFFDTQLLAQHKAPPVPQQPDSGQATPPAQPVAQAPATPAPPPVQASPDVTAALAVLDRLTADAYGEEGVEAFKAIKQVLLNETAKTSSYEEKLTTAMSELKQVREFVDWQVNQFRQQAVQQEFSQSNDWLSSMDEDLYGKDLQTATQEQRAARQKTLSEFDLLRQVVSNQKGMVVPADKALVTRAHRVAHGDRIAQAAVQKKLADLKAQSGKRLGTGTRQARPDLPPPTGDLTEDPVLLAKAQDILRRPAHDDRDVVGR